MAMKKTRIPDFSPTKKGGAMVSPDKTKGKPQPPAKTGGIKPQATSSKSGRRGS
jgi:hypothetical protein